MAKPPTASTPPTGVKKKRRSRARAAAAGARSADSSSPPLRLKSPGEEVRVETYKRVLTAEAASAVWRERRKGMHADEGALQRVRRSLASEFEQC